MRPLALFSRLLHHLLLLGLPGLVTACQMIGPGTNLLTLTGFSPKALGAADELEIQGSGFAEGKSARVAFRGDLYRPGSRVERDVEIVARTTSSSPRSLSVTMTEALRSAFTGTGDSAKHTTFRGEIEVAFAPNRSGAAPITGTLSDVVLDVDAPLVSETLQRQRDDEATRALAFLGIQLRGSDLGDCCVIGSVEGRAQAIGLGTGDLLVDLDGVTIQKQFDLVPSGRSRVARVTFRRAGSGPFITRELDVQGYKSAAPSELAPALALVGCFALWLLLARTRLGRPLEWLKYWLAVRLRESRATSLSAIRDELKKLKGPQPSWIGLPSGPGWRLIAVMALTAVTALATLVGLGVDLVSSELDLAFWVLFQTVSVTWAALLSGVSFSSKSLWLTVKAGASTLVHQIPLVALTVTVVFASHGLRMVDIEVAQGASTLGCFALKSPPLLLLTVIAVVALVPEVAELPKPRLHRGRLLAMTNGLAHLLSGTVYLWSAALLVTLLCFGGYRVPFVSETLQSSSHTWRFFGLALWFAKAVILLVSVAALRHIAGRLSVRESLSSLLRYGIGLVAVGVATARLWSQLSGQYALGWVEDVSAWILLATLIAAAFWVVIGAFRLARANRVELLPNPWI